MTDTWLTPAPKRLAMLAEATRGWTYNDIYDALIAVHDAGWSWEQICRQTFRLLLLEDSSPDDLRYAARVPRRQEGAGLPAREDTVALVAEYRARVAGQAAAGGDPEGGKVA